MPSRSTYFFSETARSSPYTKKVAGVDWFVKEQTLVELKALDVGRWKAAQWVGQQIPTLTEVLTTISDGKRLFIEVKCGSDIVPELKSLLKTAQRSSCETAVIGLSLETMTSIKRALPAIEVYLVAEQTQDTLTLC